MYKIKTEGIYKDVSSNKEMFDFSNCSTKSKYCDDSNNLVIVKMGDETGGVAAEECWIEAKNLFILSRQ